MVSNNGYQFHQYVTPSSVCKEKKTVNSKLRAQHKIGIVRLRCFNIFSHSFRHTVRRHSIVSQAVEKLIALSIILENPLFTV